MKKETKEFGTLSETYATAQLTSHCGTVDIVLPAQLELNSTLNKDNAFTAHKDLKETLKATLVFQNSLHDRFIEICFEKSYL